MSYLNTCGKNYFLIGNNLVKGRDKIIILCPTCTHLQHAITVENKNAEILKGLETSTLLPISTSLREDGKDVAFPSIFGELTWTRWRQDFFKFLKDSSKNLKDWTRWWPDNIWPDNFWRDNIWLDKFGLDSLWPEKLLTGYFMTDYYLLGKFWPDNFWPEKLLTGYFMIRLLLTGYVLTR